MVELRLEPDGVAPEFSDRFEALTQQIRHWVLTQTNNLFKYSTVFPWVESNTGILK